MMRACLVSVLAADLDDAATRLRGAGLAILSDRVDALEVVQQSATSVVHFPMPGKS
jgi:hypothetical protein